MQVCNGSKSNMKNKCSLVIVIEYSCYAGTTSCKIPPVTDAFPKTRDTHMQKKVSWKDKISSFGAEGLF